MTKPTGRRTVLAGLAATLGSAPLVALARQRGGVRRIGVLIGGAAAPLSREWVAVLVQALGSLGWSEGRNLRLEVHWGNGDAALIERFAAELVALDPDVLLVAGSPSVAALRRHATPIPIVFVNVTDPVGQGFVASLPRPGGSITGFSNYNAQMAGKWLQMLTQITPPVAHVAVLYNPAIELFAGLMMHAIENAAPSLAVTIEAAPVHDDAGIAAVMQRLAHEARGGLLVLSGAFTTSHKTAIIAAAARSRVAAVYGDLCFALAGGLMSYGVDQDDLFRRAAVYVDRILKGAKPGDLPVQDPTKFELVLNVKTAKALDITFPASLLVAADKVIE